MLTSTFAYAATYLTCKVLRNLRDFANILLENNCFFLIYPAVFTLQDYFAKLSSLLNALEIAHTRRNLNLDTIIELFVGICEICEICEVTSLRDPNFSKFASLLN